MERSIDRRTALAILGSVSVAVAGCTDPMDDGDEPDPGNETDPTPTPTPTPDDNSDDDDDDNEEEEPPDEDDVDQAAIDRATIEAGEAIDNFDEWDGSGGAYVEADEGHFLTDPHSLYVEQFGVTYATGGYDENEGFAVGDRHISTAVKVEEPTGGTLEIRFRAPDTDNRIVCQRRLPADVTDWFRVDMGITRGKGSPAMDDVQAIRVHVAGDEPSDVSFRIDDLRLTENTHDSAAILAFYGARPEHYDLVLPILEERDMTAAAVVPPHAIGEDDRIGLSELREMRDAGWDVCSFPSLNGALPELDAEDQRTTIESAKGHLEDVGFADGARHFFAPGNRINADTIDIVQEVHDTGFVYGGNSAGLPPTAPHTLPVLTGKYYDASRSAILRADIHGQLATLAFDRLGEQGMSEEDFNRQLDRIEDNDYGDGLDVITPSDLIDDYL